jgi:hypothetical protein
MSSGIKCNAKEAWNTSQQSEDSREKIHALSLAKECYSMKLDLLTNATVVGDAIRFETQGHNLKGKLKDYEYNKQLGIITTHNEKKDTRKKAKDLP